jgi:hypothetical protein
VKVVSVTIEQATLIAAVLALLASLCAGAISLYTARLRRFSSERWWERKAQSYTDLFQALFYIQLYLKRRVEEMTEGAQFAEGYMTELSGLSNAGYLEIRKGAAIGTFLFSESAAKRIQKLESDIDDPHHNEDLLEALEGDLAAIKAAIKDLRPIARDDLKLS